MHRPTKALAFFATLIFLLGATVALSTYKVAVANAYLRVRPLPAWVLPRPQPSAQVAAAAVARGAHLARVMGCGDCHGENLAGKTLADAPGRLVVGAPNLTPAAASHVARWDDVRWQKALRLGLDDEWRMLWCMPRAALVQLADADVQALVAYLRQVPPVTTAKLPQSQLGWRGYVEVALRRLRLLDRTMPDAEAWRALPPAADDPALGDYLLATGSCTRCHDAQAGAPRLTAWLGGGAVWPATDAAAPSLATLVQRSGDVAQWRQKLRAARCNFAPEGAGTAGPSAGEPGRLSSFTDQESAALWASVRRLAAPKAP